LLEERVEEHLVAVLEAAQVDVLVDVRRGAQEVAVGALQLLVEGGHVRRQQPLQAENPPLLGRERRALVEQGQPRAHVARQRRRQVPLPVIVRAPLELLHPLGPATRPSVAQRRRDGTAAGCVFRGLVVLRLVVLRGGVVPCRLVVRGLLTRWLVVRWLFALGLFPLRGPGRRVPVRAGHIIVILAGSREP